MVPFAADSRFDHVVDVYTTPFELISRLSEYLMGSLVHGGSALVVASEAHRQACAEALRSRGLDVDAMRTASRLVELDAEETLSRISINGQIDRARFHAVIGGLLTRLSARSHPVRAYGEMVALLWGDGLITAALDLEAWWNELSERTPFSLYCSYPYRVFETADCTDEFEAMCRPHSEVRGLTPTASEIPNDWTTIANRNFEATEDAARSARKLVRSALHGWVNDSVGRDAELVVSELVTNAVRHTSSRPTVVIAASRTAIRISVCDTDSRQPILMAADDEAASGRGLMIIAAITPRWGHEVTAEGKAVWAELPLGTR